MSASVAFSFAVLGFASAVGFAQSSLLEFPTPITSNEINGSIKARDIGDPRLTTYYYWFDTGQGDVFVNLVTKNFAGDIDIFVQAGLRPLSKIVIYPDFGEVETGRVLYLRKPERLLLRIQGRTPNDDAATFRLKFAGSFVAATAGADVPELPKVAGETPGAVAVNSVGTKIPQTIKPNEVVEEVRAAEAAGREETRTDLGEKAVEKNVDEARSSTENPEKETKKLEVIVSDATKTAAATPPNPVKAPPVRRTRNRTTSTSKAVDRPLPKEDQKLVIEEKGTESKAQIEKSTDTPLKNAKVDPLANVRLVILFKDGRKIERPLPEVFRFSVDRGILTVVSKDGRVGKYSMVDVVRVTIE